MRWHISGGSLSLNESLYLGILNITPDSFSDGGRFRAPEAALAQGRRLVESGASALDLGPESTRPGANPIDDAEEWARLEPVLEGLRGALPRLPLSLDTRHVPVALKGLARGAAILNDVGGFEERRMLDLARKSACGLIAMRSRMQEGRLVMPPYDDAAPKNAEAALSELRAIRDRLLQAGIAPERILLDPGFGFGTTYREDLALWEALPRFAEALEWPTERICIAVSRKRFLARRAGQPDLPPEQRDDLTEEAHREARSLGFRVFRTHAIPEPHVRPAREEDAPALARVHAASWRAAYRGMLPESQLEGLSDTEQETRMRDRIRHALETGHPMLVLDRGGSLLGFAATGPAREASTEGAGEVFAIYLHPSVWRRGLGNRLMAQAEAAFGVNGCGDVILWVLERNERARAFYRSRGWSEDGTTRTQWQDGIALREIRYHMNLKHSISPE